MVWRTIHHKNDIFSKSRLLTEGCRFESYLRSHQRVPLLNFRENVRLQPMRGDFCGDAVSQPRARLLVLVKRRFDTKADATAGGALQRH